MNSPKNRILRLVGYLLVSGVILLLAAAVILPHFVKARWTSSGVPVDLKITVTDAQTGDAIPGAKVVVWLYNDSRVSVNESNEGGISATTDARGHCVVHSYFPGSGSGGQGRLRVNSTIWIRAQDYEPYQRPTAAFLGSSLVVTGAFQTNAFSLKIKMPRR